MATPEALVGLGVAPEVAKKDGYQLVTVTTDNSTQNSAGGLLRGNGNKWVRATVGGANGAVTLPADADVGDIIVVVNVTGTAGRVFPPTGGAINQLATNTQTVLAANAQILFMRITGTVWNGFAGGALT